MSDRVDTIARWLQQEDEELLYRPDGELLPQPDGDPDVVHWNWALQRALTALDDVGQALAAAQQQAILNRYSRTIALP